MEMLLATAGRLGRRERGHGPLARWRLLREGDRGDSLAIYEVWDLWLEDPAVRQVAELLRTGLEYQFGSGAWIAGGGHDIALGGG